MDQIVQQFEQPATKSFVINMHEEFLKNLVSQSVENISKATNKQTKFDINIAEKNFQKALASQIMKKVKNV